MVQEKIVVRYALLIFFAIISEGRLSAQNVGPVSVNTKVKKVGAKTVGLSVNTNVKKVSAETVGPVSVNTNVEKVAAKTVGPVFANTISRKDPVCFVPHGKGL